MRLQSLKSARLQASSQDAADFEERSQCPASSKATSSAAPKRGSHTKAMGENSNSLARSQPASILRCKSILFEACSTVTAEFAVTTGAAIVNHHSSGSSAEFKERIKFEACSTVTAKFDMRAQLQATSKAVAEFEERARLRTSSKAALM
jgi:hypothetical protein